MFVPLMYDLARVPGHQGRMSPSQLTALLRSAVKDSDVRLFTRRDCKVELGQVCVHGLYDPHDDQAGDACIEISLVYNSSQQHLVLDPSQWQRLCFETAECIGHELVHRAQYRKRRYRAGREYCSQELDSTKKQEQQYLGSADEIEAYAFSIAAELSAMYGKFHIDCQELEHVIMYQAYVGTFDTDQSVVIKLRQQISKYLCRLEADYHDQQNSKRLSAGSGRNRTVRRTSGRK